MEKKIRHIAYTFWVDEDGVIYHKANLADLTWATKCLARDNRKLKDRVEELEAWIDRATNNPDNEVMPDLLPQRKDRCSMSAEEFENSIRETK